MNVVNRFIFGSLVIVIACGAVNAQSLRPYRKFRQVFPVAVAPVKIASVDGYRAKLIVGKWEKYDESQARVTRQTSIAFDQFEFNYDSVTGDIFPDERPDYGTSCGTGDLRWGFGPQYQVGLRYNDIKLAPGASGQRATRLGFTWMLGDPDNNGSETLSNSAHLLISTENFVTDPAQVNNPAARGDYTGVIVTFGSEVGPAPGYLWSDVDLSGGSTFVQLPFDGSGGLISAHGDYNAGTNTFSFGNCQDMLWGLKAANPFGPENNLQWNDDSPVNSTFVASELDNMTFAVCPPVLGAMTALFYDSPASETLAPVSEQIVLGTSGSGGNLTSWASNDGNARQICKFFVPFPTSPYVRVNLNYTTTKNPASAVTFRIRISAKTGGGQSTTLKVQDKTTLAFQTVASNVTVGSLPFDVSGNTTGNANNFVGSGGAMTGQIEQSAVGFQVVAFPCTSYDSANMIVSG